MHKIFLILVCFVLTHLGRRMQATKETKRRLEAWTSANADAITKSLAELHRTQNSEQVAVPNPLRALAILFLVPSQAAAFSFAPRATGARYTEPIVGPGVAAPFVVPSSIFASELAYRTEATSAYEASPLASLDSLTRGKVLAGFARRCDADEHPGAVMEDAVAAGKRDNGTKRSQTEGPSDWRRDGKRVACKSAQLRWQEGGTAKEHKRWSVQFMNVKPDASDDLLLVLHAPDGVHLFRHNGTAGLSTGGKHASKVQFKGPSNEPDWRVALHEILVKINARTIPLTSASFDDPRLTSVIVSTPLPFTASAYGDVPLADQGINVRDSVLTSMVRRLDEDLLHQGAVITDAVPDEGISGTPQGAYRKWVRDGKRVTCRTGELGWKDGVDLCWQLSFRRVQSTAYDELLLAAYTPEGVYLFRHDGKTGLGTGQIQYYGSKNERDWRVALVEILGEMEAKGFRQLVFLPWDV